MTPAFQYRAIVRSVYDADTIRADIDLGFNIWAHNEQLRLYGVNAPELRGEEKPKGEAARDWLQPILPKAVVWLPETIPPVTSSAAIWCCL